MGILDRSIWVSANGMERWYQEYSINRLQGASERFRFNRMYRRNQKELSNKKKLLVALLMLSPLLYFGIQCYRTYRKEPAVITNMYWRITSTIEERRERNVSTTDDDGNTSYHTETYWVDVYSRYSQGGRSDTPYLPAVRQVKYRERLRTRHVYTVSSQSKLDKRNLKYNTGSCGEWRRYNIKDEILVRLSFDTMVWGIEPYSLEG